MKLIGVTALLPVLPELRGLLAWITFSARASAEAAAYDALLQRGGYSKGHCACGAVALTQPRELTDSTTSHPP